MFRDTDLCTAEVNSLHVLADYVRNLTFIRKILSTSANFLSHPVISNHAVQLTWPVVTHEQRRFSRMRYKTTRSQPLARRQKPLTL